MILAPFNGSRVGPRVVREKKKKRRSRWFLLYFSTLTERHPFFVALRRHGPGLGVGGLLWRVRPGFFRAATALRIQSKSL